MGQLSLQPEAIEAVMEATKWPASGPWLSPHVIYRLPSFAAVIPVDARVRPVDIDQIAPGQKAQVHFLPYAERTLPQICGSVRSISADSLLDETTGDRCFLAKVEMPPDELAKLGPDAWVPTGMPAEVLIMTGNRTVLQYLVQPILELGFCKWLLRLLSVAYVLAPAIGLLGSYRDAGK
jgi:hypothetical protein